MVDVSTMGPVAARSPCRRRRHVPPARGRPGPARDRLLRSAVPQRRSPTPWSTSLVRSRYPAGWLPSLSPELPCGLRAHRGPAGLSVIVAPAGATEIASAMVEAIEESPTPRLRPPRFLPHRRRWRRPSSPRSSHGRSACRTSCRAPGADVDHRRSRPTWSTDGRSIHATASTGSLAVLAEGIAA
jgi:hypothetical protein